MNKVYASEFIGKLTGNADTATKATQDESGNNIKSSYASSISISDHTITLKNKNGSSLGTVTVPDNNTWRPLGTTADTACAGNDARLSNSRPASDVYAWAKASSKPSYTWDEITNKPSSFTPASHTHNYAGSSSAGGSATSAVSVVDYADSSKTIKIGFAGAGATTSNLAYIAGYLSGGTQIKDVNKDTLKSWLGLGSAAYTNSDAFANSSHTHTKSQITDFPTSLPANGGTSTYANNVWTQSHNGSWYINSNWNGTYFITNAKSTDGSTLPIWVNNSGYADSAGNASTATTLTTSAGSVTQPVYFSSGKPVACSYTLGKSVPSNAVFTDTNTWRPVTDNLTSTSTSNCLSANQGRVLKGLIDGKAASDHTHSNYLENGDYISCENSIVSIDGDLDVPGMVNIGQCAKVEESYVSCVKIITSGSKVTITIPRNNLGYSTALLDDVSIKCYLSGYGENHVDIYNNRSTTVAARWSNSSLSSLYPTMGCSYSSTTATITLTATFSTTLFLVIRYCPGLTTITVS